MLRSTLRKDVQLTLGAARARLWVEAQTAKRQGLLVPVCNCVHEGSVKDSPLRTSKSDEDGFFLMLIWRMCCDASPQCKYPTSQLPCCQLGMLVEKGLGFRVEGLALGFRGVGFRVVSTCCTPRYS